MDNVTAPRPCIDCGKLTNATRCTPCAGAKVTAREATRPPRQQRGYDAAHDAARRALVAQLPTPCGYGCGKTLTTPRQLIAAHRVDGQPEHGWIASCRSCNERAKRTVCIPPA